MLIFILIFCSCKNPQDDKKSEAEPFDYFSFNKKKDVISHELPIESKNLSRIFKMHSIDDFLIVGDFSDSTHFYKVFSCSTGKLILKFGKKGDGPNEFRFPSDIKINGKDLEFYEGNKHSYSSINLDSLLLKHTFKATNISNKFHIGTLQATKVGEYFLCTGVFDNRFIVTNMKGETVSKIGKYPFQEELLATNKSSGLAMAFQGLFEKSNNNIAFVSLASPNIDFLRYANNNFEIVKAHHIRPPIFEGSKSDKNFYATFSRDNKMSFLSSTSNDKYIYVLYSEKTIRKDKMDAFNARDVIVFDWDGNPITYLTLDKKVNNIAVNKSGSILYGFFDDAEPKILSFQIKENDYLNNISNK